MANFFIEIKQISGFTGIFHEFCMVRLIHNKMTKIIWNFNSNAFYLIDKLVVGPMKTNSNSVNSNLNLDEKAIMSYSLDLICSYLVELQSVTLASANEKEITEQLKKLKSTIEFCGVRH